MKGGETKVTRRELAMQISLETGITPNKAELVVKTVCAVITETLADGESVRLQGFGAFEIRDRPARNGYNPKTRTNISIPAGRYVRFKAGKILKENLLSG